MDLEDFLRNKAFTFEDKAKSRTYLLLDKKGIENRQINIMAYFAIAPQIMYLPAELSVRQIKRLDGFSGKIHGEKLKALPVYLIGQLSKNDEYKEAIEGKIILSYAMSIIYRAYRAIGGRIVMVDVKSSATGLLRFYRNNGFEFISSDEDTGLSQLIYLINE